MSGRTREEWLYVDKCMTRTKATSESIRLKTSDREEEKEVKP